MSRNKTIYWLHNVTGLNYSVLRTALKSNKWDAWRALCAVKGYNPEFVSEFAESCAKFMADFVEAMRPTMEAIADFCTTFTDAMLEAGLDLMELEGGESNGN